MGVKEYPIEDAWKHEECSTPSYISNLEDAYEAMKNAPFPDISSLRLKEKEIIFTLHDNKTPCIMFLDGICKEHNLSLFVPEQNDGWDKIVHLEPSDNNQYIF